MEFTKEELIILSDALQFAIDNGLADDYEDTEKLFELNNRLSELYL